MNPLQTDYKNISKEQFEEKLLLVVRLGIRTWERRRLIIEADMSFNPATYKNTPQESGMVCEMCSSHGTTDPLKLSHIFKAYNTALSTGNKELVLKTIDDGIAATKAKVKEVYGRDL